MELIKAKAIADGIIEKLSPHCEKCVIGGSIRREKEFVKDIEIICVPKMNGKRRWNTWCNEVFHLGNIIKGKNLGLAKYVKIGLPEGILLDLFVPDADVFGTNLMIRTGSTDYVKSILVKFNKLGYNSNNCVLVHKDGHEMRFDCEEALFFHLGMEVPDPKTREV